ncbi:hypothetical protein PQX77_017106 [Marasmius sp. AFHP31]|nr:hypothetical protein PQX77_017106 [Marasmius sp. AFHP31]
MTTPTLISRSNAPTLLRTPFSNITNFEYQTASITPRSASPQPPLKKPESISVGLQETYEHSDPFNTLSESFYCPQIIYDFPCFDDLENFSIYRKSSAREMPAPSQNHKRTSSVSFSPWVNDTSLPETLCGGRVEENGRGHQLLAMNERFKWDSVVLPVTPTSPKDPSLEVGIFVTPPTPPKQGSLRTSYDKNARTSTVWLSDDDWNASGDLDDDSEDLDLQDAYGGISEPMKPEVEVVWWK